MTRSCSLKLFVFALLIGFSCLPATGQNIPAGAPPDVQAIMQKMKSGQRPTPAEMQRLQQWAADLNSHLNTSSAGGSQFGAAAKTEQQGIPCRIEVTGNYTSKSPGGGTETFQINLWTKAVLYPDIKGTGDYNLNALNPSVPVSSFRFEPYSPGGQIAMVGGGDGRKVSHPNPHETGTSEFHATSASFSGLLVTSGQGDALYGEMGSIGGLIEGTVSIKTDDGTRNFALKDSSGRQASVTFPFAEENEHKMRPGEVTPTPTMQLSYRAMVAAIQSGKSGTVTGTESFGFDRNGTHYEGTSTLTITLRPSALQLVIEPADEGSYEKWLPMPDSSESGNKTLYGDPKPIPIHLALIDMEKAPAPGKAGGGTVPNTEEGSQIDVYLNEVSTMKGISMNYPQNGDTKPDLYFPKQQPDGIVYLDEGHVQTRSNLATEATVLVAARDTGAYGVVQGKSIALGLEARNLRTDTKALSLPMDDNGNHIADQWEKDGGIYGKNLPPKWDEEDTPSGMKQKGDGVSLFEEYRGFLMQNGSGKEVFERFSPQQSRKKLFIYLDEMDRTLHKAGADLFAASTGIEIVYIDNVSRMSTDGGSKYAKWVNFNETPFTNAPQDAVWVVDVYTDGPGYTEGLKDFPETSPKTPETTEFVNVSREAMVGEVNRWQEELSTVPVDQKYVAAAAALHLDIGTILKTLSSRSPELVSRFIIFVTLHELGHAVGAMHHGAFTAGFMFDNLTSDDLKNEGVINRAEQLFTGGSPSCPMRYWQEDKDARWVISFLAGTWDPSSGTLEGGQWKFCTDDWPNISIKP